MKIATITFLIFGICYLILGVSLVVSQGPNFGSLLMAILATAFLYQSYELSQNKHGARWRAIISSVAMALLSGYIASKLLLPSFNAHLSVSGVGAAVIFIAFVVVIVMLSRSSVRRV